MRTGWGGALEVIQGQVAVQRLHAVTLAPRRFPCFSVSEDDRWAPAAFILPGIFHDFLPSLRATF